MGGIPVVEVTRGGIPVTESDRGVPYEIAANGRGIPVRFVSSGGVPFQGVGEPVLRYIDGILAVLLIDADGAPCRDYDGAYLYEVL